MAVANSTVLRDAVSRSKPFLSYEVSFPICQYRTSYGTVAPCARVPHCPAHCSNSPTRPLRARRRCGRSIRTACALPPAVRLEVHAHERIGADLTAEADELAGAHLVRLDATPEQIDQRLTGARAGRRLRATGSSPQRTRPTASSSARGPSSPRRRLPARLPHVVPRRLDRAVGGAERFHELHVEVRRESNAASGPRRSLPSPVRSLLRRAHRPRKRNRRSRARRLLQKVSSFQGEQPSGTAPTANSSISVV